LQGFVHHVEAVTLAQCVVEIDVIRKNFRDLHAHSIGNAGIVDGGKERGLNGGAGQLGRTGVGRGLDP